MCIALITCQLTLFLIFLLQGYKLGTLCIVDTRPRPAGLSEDEKDALRDLADMVIKLMVDRRFRLQTEEQEQAEEPVEEPTPASPAQLIAYTAHDLMTPLTGVQLSLSLLKDDEEVQRQLGSHHLELVKTAANCSDLMLRICQTVIDTLRQETAAGAPAGVTGTTATATASVGVAQSDNINMPVTKMIDLVNSLCMIMKPIPKHVPLIVTLDPAVPPIIMSDDLKLFRSALNLLSHAMSRTELGYVHLKISTKEDNGHLLFECENTGKDVEEEEYQYLFQPGRTEDGSLHLGLSSAASLINSLDGQYGFRAIAKAEGQRRTGSIFWFSVPLFLPGDVGRNEKVAQQQRKPKLPVIPLVRSVASVASNNRSLSSLVPGDILQAESLQSCCVNATVDPEANAPILTNGKKPGTRQRRALVIDDSLVVRKSLALALNQLGFDVTQAKDGLEGFARLKETVFDVTLCDFLMPVMDGMDCVEQYREWESKNRAGFRQLIVGMSAHASANDHGQGLKAGMDDFKPKPISMKDLTEIQDSDVARKQNEKLNALGGTKVSGTGSSATKVVDGEPAESATSKRAAEETPSTEAKRPRKTPIDVPMETGTPVCLIATDKSSVEPNDVLTTLESKGWKVVVVHDGEDALHLLQTRNWDAVLIDDDLPILAGTPCVTKFREWEQNNRDKRQLNVCLVCNGDIPSPGDKASTIQPPHGVDGVLGKPAQWKNLQCVMDKNEKDGTLGGVGRGPA